MAQKDLAEKSKINLSTLKSIENDHQQATSYENLSALALALGCAPEEMIAWAREKDPWNVFILKQSVLSEDLNSENMNPWFSKQRMKFPDYDITCLSPPFGMNKDFLILRLNLPPKRSFKISNSFLSPAMGLIREGFQLQFSCDGKTQGYLNAHQGFAFTFENDFCIENQDSDAAAVIYLCGNYPLSGRPPSKPEKSTPDSSDFDLARAVNALMSHLSTRPGKSISVRELADRSDFLDHEQIHKMLRKEGPQAVIHWEKIEDLLSASGMSLSNFFASAYGRHHHFFATTHTTDRSLIDLSHYQGLRYHSCSPPIASLPFACYEMIFSNANTRLKKVSRQNPGMLCIYVEDGSLAVTIGERLDTFILDKSESVYFDCSLGYQLENASKRQTKCFLAAKPRLIF